MNNNLDNVVIGALQGAEFVSVYSMGLLIFGMFEHLSTAISSVMLPTVTNVLRQEDGLQRVQKNIVQAGRIQFALLGAALVGFAVLGRDFVGLWLGAGYEDVYPIALVLMIPAILELCVNVCLAVLRAKNMLGFRTIVISCTTVLNAVITIVGVHFYGYMAAAVGTAVSFIVGSLIIMNIYYHTRLSFNMIKIYREIFRGTWICLLLAGSAILASSCFLPRDCWWAFCVNAGVYCVVYVTTMLLFGLNKQEKKSMLVLNKLWKNKKEVKTW
jgi:O-antigen/teichoic acid export membrane protein